MKFISLQTVRSNLRQFQDLRKKTRLVILCTLTLSFFSGSDDLFADYKYVGAEGCKCHRSEIMDWQGSKHARAFELLLPDKRRVAKKRAGLNPASDYSRDAECIPCHVVGYNAKGGFLDIDTSPLMAGVGCESCHGAGEKYRLLHGKKPRTFKRKETRKLGQVYSSIEQSVCKKCHGHPDSPFKPSVHKKYDFNWKEGLKRTTLFHSYYPLKSKH